MRSFTAVIAVSQQSLHLQCVINRSLRTSLFPFTSFLHHLTWSSICLGRSWDSVHETDRCMQLIGSHAQLAPCFPPTKQINEEITKLNLELTDCENEVCPSVCFLVKATDGPCSIWRCQHVFTVLSQRPGCSQFVDRPITQPSPITAWLIR